MSAPVATVTLHPALDETVVLPALAPGTVHQAEALRFDAGGKGVNVAGYLADWGVPVLATGLLGEENAGPFADLFARKGIQDRFVRVPGSTRINVKLVDRTRGETTDVNLPAPPPPAGALEALRRRVDELAGTCEWFVLAGSLPPGLPPDAYRRLVTALRARGRRVAVDTSGAPLAEAIAAAPDLVKPNRAELEGLLGTRLGGAAELARAARELRARGPRIVAVSLGAEGAIFVGEGEAWWARPLAVEVATTTGAGDALVAGLVAGLREGRPLEGCARLATAFAAAKLGRIGPHLGPVEDVARLEGRVELSPLKED